MYQARRFVYTIFKSRFLEKWIQSFSGLHLQFWESGECVPPVCDDESGKTIVYTIFKPKFLEKWIHSFSGLHFLSCESGASGLWCGWTTWTLQFSVSITISMLARGWLDCGPDRRLLFLSSRQLLKIWFCIIGIVLNIFLLLGSCWFVNLC